MEIYACEQIKFSSGAQLMRRIENRRWNHALVDATYLRVCVCAWCGHKNMIIITVIIVCCVEMDSATATMSFPNSNAAYFCFTIFAVMRSSHCMFVCFFDGFCCFSILIDVERSAMKLQFVRVWWLWGPLNHVAFMGFHRRRLFGNDIVQQPRFTANSPCKLL